MMAAQAMAMTALALTGAGAVGFASASDAATEPKKPVRKNVKVADNFYSPKKLRVPPKSTIVWKWSRLNGDSHDVYLEKGPKGARKFQSAPAATDFSFKRKLRKVGRYMVICTFHENMAMTIRVAK
jgi:plastocyanin